MMAIALRMAKRGLGRTRPNPSVGAVIADEATGEVISRAVTAPGGRPHAETEAIKAAGARARGAAMYVTLEPCAHFGLTPPCADAIIAAGLKRVVAAIEDPDPRVSGRGLDRLRAAGIEVARGVGAVEARWLARGHIVRVTERRPFVTLKLALDAEGGIARGDGRPTWVTSEAARAHGHLLRAESDAILVGSGTLRDDDPELTCRLPGMFQRSPIRVVLARDLDIRAESRLVQTAKAAPTWLIAAIGASDERKAQFQALGVEVIEAATLQGRLWLPSVMDALVARGVTRLLVEGGPTIWRAFADAGLYDEVALFMAGHDLGKPRRAPQRVIGDLPLAQFDLITLESDTYVRFRRQGAKEGT